MKIGITTIQRISRDLMLLIGMGISDDEIDHSASNTLGFGRFQAMSLGASPDLGHSGSNGIIGVEFDEILIKSQVFVKMAVFRSKSA